MPTPIEADELPPVVGLRLLQWLQDLSHRERNPYQEIDDDCEPGPSAD